MRYAVDFIKMTERSVSLILVILGNFDHFSHLFTPLFQPDFMREGSTN
ncbi:hypothetical protein D1AOALGA4SA_8950 [Olavius algarvensis Delta 1 endosymbiont]|nr:hypothetical protein D1AOALGA4SA_8950 [Olavius algarvensis Delta 1 endosymbiont]